LKCKWESELVQHMVMTFAVLGATDLCAEHRGKEMCHYQFRITISCLFSFIGYLILYKKQ